MLNQKNHTDPVNPAKAGIQIRKSFQSLVERNNLRADFFDDLLRRRLYEHPGYYGEMIWVSIMLDQWLRGHAP